MEPTLVKTSHDMWTTLKPGKPNLNFSVTFDCDAVKETQNVK